MWIILSEWEVENTYVDFLKHVEQNIQKSY